MLGKGIPMLDIETFCRVQDSHCRRESSVIATCVDGIGRLGNRPRCSTTVRAAGNDELGLWFTVSGQDRILKKAPARVITKR
ncbi:hypothetical protein IM25_24545 (plasmid) [Rhodococcus sp. p52]|uniref:Uncharacterized protein n=1 Tax=Rhodococcus pyridinivorans AK37 TaxID=1114960 RepID=H0JUF1_9NOCA|nr:hypothetical protein IM25_24545 [Rhodococcus sp. p52]AYA27428.1 hypothetical protein C6369_025405 [Rhodococcus rhodochrous]EHK82249.1 hypothetical protein AK37_16625 [Rhodococcus pyridinivorans AK37]